ncbi:hypothetical protein PY365_32810 [Roseiarcaceae bacterium H3SJ34-1]|uniref:hypothetical protein n=1 Tax=Terripilifer ovatus TaxID=3032367 RepID=UPI003AB98A13|nr:hypothetical protein [Roseiarcaceae bacterium H3SJ34-1]
MMFAYSDISKYCAVGALAAVALAASIGDSFAQRARAPGSPGRITLENKRAATLTELKIIGKEGAAAERVIATNLAPGKKITVTLPARIGCIFDLAGTYDDDSTIEVADSNLCKDKALRLVE